MRCVRNFNTSQYVLYTESQRAHQLARVQQLKASVSITSHAIARALAFSITRDLYNGASILRSLARCMLLLCYPSRPSTLI